MTGAALSALLENKIVCAHRIGGAADPMLRWSELHTGDGTAGAQTLGEQGRGSTDPARSYNANIGTWQLIDTNDPVDGVVDQVRYVYTDDGTYLYTIRLNSGTYYYCSGGADASAQIKGTPAGIPAAAASNPCNW